MLIPFAIKYRGLKRWLVALISLVNACLLMFTINRGTMIGFCMALVLMAIYFSWKLVLYKKMIALLCMIAAVMLIVEFMPQEIKIRFLLMISDGEAFIQEGYDNGSVSTRLKIWEILMSHKQDFWLFGDGPLYGSDCLRDYFVEAGYERYVNYGFVYHNQYLAYFHHYGILGLLFLPFLLFYPLYAMIRYCRFSVTLTAIIIVFAFACIEDRYLGKTMVAAILFVFFFSYFQLDKWRCVEDKDGKDVEPVKLDIAK
jgi:O-antigen ligase